MTTESATARTTRRIERTRFWFDIALDAVGLVLMYALLAGFFYIFDEWL